MQKDGQVETNCKFLVKLTMQCSTFYHLISIVYIASTHIQLAGCDNVKHVENECIQVPRLQMLSWPDFDIMSFGCSYSMNMYLCILGLTFFYSWAVFGTGP